MSFALSIPSWHQRFIGPFQIIECVGPVACRLELPTTLKLHPVFHVAQLRKAVGSVFSLLASLPNLHPNLSLNLKPMGVLGLRNVPSSSSDAEEFEV